MFIIYTYLLILNNKLFIVNTVSVWYEKRLAEKYCLSLGIDFVLTLFQDDLLILLIDLQYSHCSSGMQQLHLISLIVFCLIVVIPAVVDRLGDSKDQVCWERDRKKRERQVCFYPSWNNFNCMTFTFCRRTLFKNFQ